MTLNISRHTLFLANTPTPRLLILIPSRTHSQSQQTQKRILVSHSTRITLVTEDNLKSIQAESYSTNFQQSQLFEKLKKKTLFKIRFRFFLYSVFSEFIQRYSLLSNLNKILNCIKRLVKAFNDWSVSN